MVDSREQAPLKFSHPYITEVIRTKLEFGDYACMFADNTIPPLVFERKNLPDLFSTLTSGHERFKREIARAKEANHSIVIIIEGTFTDVLRGCTHSTVKGITIIKQLFTFWFKYGVQFVCCENRAEMATYITECFCSIGRMKKIKDTNETKVAV